MILGYREIPVFFSSREISSVAGILDCVQFSVSDQGNTSLFLTLLVVMS